jgi:hypothetical protein
MSRASRNDTSGYGFIVKQPEEPWFQLEWKFANQAANEFGFELIKIGAPDGAKLRFSSIRVNACPFVVTCCVAQAQSSVLTPRMISALSGRSR